MILIKILKKEIVLWPRRSDQENVRMHVLAPDVANAKRFQCGKRKKF